MAKIWYMHHLTWRELINMNEKVSVKVISMEDIIKSGCYNIKTIISLIENAMLDFKKGKILLPDKISQIFDEKTQNRINCMPSTLIEKKICGVKWVSVFPQNPHRFNVPNVTGTIILSEINKGFPFAIMDGTLITALRTACMGAIGAKYLAKKDSQIYGSIGAGEQARMHFIAIKNLFPGINKCYVASRTEDSEQDFVDKLKNRFSDVEFIKCNSDFRMASKDSDIIVTAVSCQEPLLKADAIKKGAFYCHVGGWEDEFEVPLKADKIVCDNWNALKHRGSPTIAKLYKDGRLSDSDIYCDIVDIIDGTKKGRENSEEFNYFNSIGLSFVDIEVAYAFYKQVVDHNLGYDWSIKEKNILDSIL